MLRRSDSPYVEQWRNLPTPTLSKILLTVLEASGLACKERASRLWQWDGMIGNKSPKLMQRPTAVTSLFVSVASALM